MKRCFTFLTLSLLSLSAQAELKKWVDADGKVIYSDTRPGENFQLQSLRNFAGQGSATTPAPEAPKTYVEREAEMKKARQGQAEQEKKQAHEQAVSETRKQNCQSAREAARTLESGARIVVNDENGEPSFIDDEAREQRLTAARKAISDNCD